MNRNITKKSYKMNCVGNETKFIILLNIIVFIVILSIPSMKDKLFLNPHASLIISRPWTLVTVFFSHEVPLHIFLNMVLLFIFGTALEKITTPKTLFSLYIIAGLIGALVVVPVSTLFATQDLIAGASAAVFGIVTAFAVIRPNAQILGSKAKWWVLALFIFNVITIVLNSQAVIGSSAHLAGIMVGIVFGSWLKRNEIKTNSRNRA